MDKTPDKLMEAQVRKAVQKACKNLRKMIESEPETLIVESDDTLTYVPTEAAADILAFLFKRG